MTELKATDTPIHWSASKIKFVLRNLSVFQRGELPNAEDCGRHSKKLLASFVNAVETGAEAVMRCERAFMCTAPPKVYYNCEHEYPGCLKTCPVCKYRKSDGWLVLDIFAEGDRAWKVARNNNLTVPELWKRVNRAMRYAADDNCLIVDYQAWRKIKKR